MKLLATKAAERRIKKYSAWKFNKKCDEVSIDIPCSSFVDGLACIARIAVHAEILKIYPIITLKQQNVHVIIKKSIDAGFTTTDASFVERITNILIQHQITR
jgi:pterin-4a-carbinolamine dehydratase